MGTQSKTIKLPIIFAAITALIICTVLGVVGIRIWRLLRPKPIFSFDTMEISQIQIHGRAGLGGESNIVMILDQERIEYIVGFLNNFSPKSEEEFTQSKSCATQLSLFTTNGDVTWVYFDTYNDGTPDAISIEKINGGSTKYTTAPGYFWELTKMPSTDPSYFGDEPDKFGPSAVPGEG